MFNSLSAVKWNFIDWNKLFGWSVEGQKLSVGEYAAQYADVETNFVLLFVAIVGILVLAFKGMSLKKKWWWYAFFTSTICCAITSVVMHNSDYGEFQRYVMTSKLLGSWIDMSFTLCMAYTAILCFIMEFMGKKAKKWLGGGVSLFFAYAMIYLAIEVFVLHDRPLVTQNPGAPMDGTVEGMSMAELNCLLLALPIVPIFLLSWPVMKRNERGMMGLTIGVFVVAVIFSNALGGDHEILPALNGIIFPHAWWHMLASAGVVCLMCFAECRVGQDNPRKDVDWFKIPKPVTEGFYEDSVNCFVESEAGAETPSEEVAAPVEEVVAVEETEAAPVAEETAPAVEETTEA